MLIVWCQHQINRNWVKTMREFWEHATQEFQNSLEIYGRLFFSMCAPNHFQQYFSYIVVVSFIGGGNRSAGRKPSTCRKSLTTLSHNGVWSTSSYELHLIFNIERTWAISILFERSQYRMTLLFSEEFADNFVLGIESMCAPNGKTGCLRCMSDLRQRVGSWSLTLWSTDMRRTLDFFFYENFIFIANFICVWLLALLPLQSIYKCFIKFNILVFILICMSVFCMLQYLYMCFVQ
jgi:hypothetical protein